MNNDARLSHGEDLFTFLRNDREAELVKLGEKVLPLYDADRDRDRGGDDAPRELS